MCKILKLFWYLYLLATIPASRSWPCASLLVRLEHVKASHIHSAKTTVAPATTTIPSYNTGYNDYVNNIML